MAVGDGAPNAEKQLADRDVAHAELLAAKRAFVAAPVPAGVAVRDMPEFKRAEAAIRRLSAFPSRSTLLRRAGRRAEERPPATSLFGWALTSWEERLAALGMVDVSDLCHLTWPVHDPPYEETV
jgi:hypothetical protein